MPLENNGNVNHMEFVGLLAVLAAIFSILFDLSSHFMIIDPTDRSWAVMMILIFTLLIGYKNIPRNRLLLTAFLSVIVLATSQICMNMPWIHQLAYICAVLAICFFVEWMFE